MLPRTADSFPHLTSPSDPGRLCYWDLPIIFTFFMWYLTQNVTTASPFSPWSANICQSDSRSSTILFSLDKPSYKARGSLALLALLSQSSCTARLEPEGRKRSCSVPRSCHSTGKGDTHSDTHLAIFLPSRCHHIHAHKGIWQQAQEAARERQGSSSEQSPPPAHLEPPRQQHTQGMLLQAGWNLAQQGQDEGKCSSRKSRAEPGLGQARCSAPEGLCSPKPMLTLCPPKAIKRSHQAKNRGHLIKTRQTHFICLLTSWTVKQDQDGFSSLSLQLPRLSFVWGEKNKKSKLSSLAIV